ncbi:hypothetical protein RchiOBHm_Chr4g0424551 [Rosa chinensis]|uniref:KIB1-4 beta-propeller domain-containing protein n=1 Tax=Rosa chinensis TaxID=74649 RepID=A0A2P6QYX6_ROSCH|nr:uncharacterized protein LOC121052960 [Rosa chinensis]PRQ39381.1 hypothetical protein RchiOBHm_Chr4g0424551 [Rosa chinensis]
MSTISESVQYKQANQHGRWHTKELVPPPMLLVRNKTQTTLYSVSEGEVYNNGELPGLPPRTKWCCGSSHGWLATVDELTNQGVVIALRNPFRKSSPIRLPPLKEEISEAVKHRCQNIVYRVILSADPALNPDNYMVLALYCTDDHVLALALFNASHGRWHFIEAPSDIFDAIFYKGRVYAIGYSGEIVSVNVDNPGQAKQLTPSIYNLADYCVYLVESTKGDLLTIQRRRRRQPHDASIEEALFIVYKVVFNEGDGSIEKQVEVEDIGDEALFVDDMHSISVSTSNYPRVRRNSIYYIKDNYCLEDQNLEDRNITKHHELRSPFLIGLFKWIVDFILSLCGLQSASNLPVFLEWHQLPL